MRSESATSEVFIFEHRGVEFHYWIQKNPYVITLRLFSPDGKIVLYDTQPFAPDVNIANVVTMMCDDIIDYLIRGGRNV